MERDAWTFCDLWIYHAAYYGDFQDCAWKRGRVNDLALKSNLRFVNLRFVVRGAGRVKPVFFWIFFTYNGNMQFELTGALIGDILFSMEDQNGRFLLNTAEGVVVDTELDGAKRTGETGRFIALPEWGPSEGFRLMERFTAGLRSPVVREELSAVLNRGKGVFRAFKDAIARRPELEKRWFKYKEREMRRVIIRWYNALREEWGMELIGEEPEEFADLALEDFRFREGAAADGEAAAALHRICGEAQRFGAADQWTFPGDCCLVAETAGGDFAAYISACRVPPSRLHIHALEVNPEYRGLGLGETLLERLLEQADRGGLVHLSIDLPAGSETFSRALFRKGFTPGVQRYCRNRI